MAATGHAASPFGTLLLRCRRAAGLTQEELAARAGLSARGISDLERGARRLPRHDTLALLLEARAPAPAERAALLAAAQPEPGPATSPRRPRRWSAGRTRSRRSRGCCAAPIAGS